MVHPRSGPVVRVGTSGWVYPDWRGVVYPQDLPQRRWLAALARRFPTVEINASFYRLPERSTFERWASEVPPGFRFAVKMSRFVTHVRRLREPAEPLARFWERAAGLGDALGPVLFQLPPRFRVDLGLLRELLAVLPRPMQAAFEFRDPSWATDPVLEALDRAGAAWVLADHAGAPVTAHVTGGWSYLRFHRGRPDRFDYAPAVLRRWAGTIVDLPVREVYAYFNNDPGGAAVRDAERLIRLLARRGVRQAAGRG
ncbi:MAG: histidine kinase [Actinomycetota bacterium]|nr:MAG: histidine kinase [Actinomycetota bacterium]